MATALETLLARIAAERGGPIPEPAAPVGGLGPLDMNTNAAFRATNPEPVLPKIVQPAAPDQGFVNQYAGAAPVAPTIKPPSLLEKIITVIGGAGAGLAGNGPAYVEQIRRQRREPIERFERESDLYDQRRTRGLELAERRAEREAEQANRLNEQVYERDFKVWLSKNNDRADEAKIRMQQVFQLKRDAEAARIQEQREQRRERLQQEREADRIEERYFTVSRNRALSRELGRHWAGLSDKPLSPAAAKLDAQLAGFAEDRNRRLASGGTGRAGGASSAASEALQRFELSRQGLIGALQRGDQKSAQAYREAMNRNYRTLARFPKDIELSTTNPDWPYARMRNATAPSAAPAGAQPQPQGDPLGILK